ARETDERRGDFRRRRLALFAPSGDSPRTTGRSERHCRRDATPNTKSTMTPNESESHASVSSEAKNHSTRRDFLLMLGFVINTIPALMIEIPIIVSLYTTWTSTPLGVWPSLNPIPKSPEGATRRAVPETPDRREADGQTSRVTCWVSRIQGDQF